MTPAGTGSGCQGNALSIPAPLGLRHFDGQPVTLEDAARMVGELARRITERSGSLRALEAQGKQCDPYEHAALCREARLDALRIRAWSALELLAREAAVLL